MYRFQEHDVLITLTTLSELDRRKTGQTDVAHNTQQVSRVLDEIIDETAIAAGAPFNAYSRDKQPDGSSWSH